jgi:enterochelin esterase-like enzyme
MISGKPPFQSTMAHLPQKVRWIACLLAALVSAQAPAQWTTPPVSAPGVQYRTFWSPAANATVSFHVYLPPEYATDTTARFPVLYWLHGSGSPTSGIAWLSSWYGNAMTQGKIPPMIVVFPNGMGSSMWCDSKDGTVPMETVVTENLVPHVDATFRTIAARNGRIVEGFSMGGAGSGRLGLRHTDLFAGMSLLGAGPMQLDFMQAPQGTDVPQETRAQLYEKVWSSDPAYYLQELPWTVAEQRADAHVRLGSVIRIGVGSLDAMLTPNQDFHQHLISLGVPHQFVVVPGVGHDPPLTLQGLGEEGWAFYRAALASPELDTADLDCDGLVNAGDIGSLLLLFGPCSGGSPGCEGDLDASGTVDAGDIGSLLLAFD